MTGNERISFVFDGGTPDDQQQLEAFYEQLWRANDSLGDETLRPVWSDDPSSVFFNTNGHTYHGLEDWFRIWAHYRNRLVAPVQGASKQVRVTVRADMAVIIDEHRSRALKWVAADAEPDYITDYMRATVVCLRENGGWRGMHAHYSSGRPGPRPETVK